MQTPLLAAAPCSIEWANREPDALQTKACQIEEEINEQIRQTNLKLADMKKSTEEETKDTHALQLLEQARTQKISEVKDAMAAGLQKLMM
eukprot:2594417-Karenia_brevis.AAC.1